MYKNLVAIDNRMKKLISLVLARTSKDIIEYLNTLPKEELEILGLGRISIQAENIKQIVDQLHLKWMFMRWQEYGINQKSYAEGESLIYVYGNPIADTYRKDFEAIYKATEVPAINCVFGVIDECRRTRREVCRLTWNDIKLRLDRKIRKEENMQKQ